MRRSFLPLGLIVSLWAGASGCSRPLLSAAPSAAAAEPPPTLITPRRATVAAAVTPRPDAGTIRFTNVAATAGLRYRFVIRGSRPLNLLQTMGNGCAFLDYDKDGNLDILLIGRERLALYRGNGHGQFTDVTQQTGLDKLRGSFFGCAVGDYDNDGYPDIYVSGCGTGLLLHNEKGRAFRDVTAAAGLSPQPWGTSCAFADIDGDGFLDLYVCDYVRFGPKDPQLCDEVGGVRAACHPSFYKALTGRVFRNRNGRRFEDVTDTWLAGQQTGNGLGVACADFDASGRISLAIANDALNGDLFENPGQGPLKNIGLSSGTARDGRGKAHAGMGIDWGDYDNDGKPDLFVTTFVNEPKCLYHNDGNGLFMDVTAETAIEPPLRPYVSFGCKFIDADNDGWLDLIVASGHVEDNVAVSSKGHLSYREPVELLRNAGHSPVVFTRATEGAGLGKLPPIVGRGLAVGDCDNDGRMDALIVDGEGAPLLLHNETHRAGHWLGLRLVGTHCNRDAYGAVVTVTLADGQTRVRLCRADGSYLSSSDPRVHIGLGAGAVKDVTIRWPDGRRQTWKPPARDRYYTVTER